VGWIYIQDLPEQLITITLQLFTCQPIVLQSCSNPEKMQSLAVCIHFFVGDIVSGIGLAFFGPGFVRQLLEGIL